MLSDALLMSGVLGQVISARERCTKNRSELSGCSSSSAPRNERSSDCARHRELEVPNPAPPVVATPPPPPKCHLESSRALHVPVSTTLELDIHQALFVQANSEESSQPSEIYKLFVKNV